MYRNICWFSLAACLLALPRAAGGDTKSRLPDALALEETMQEAIRKAEPSIACILVSRSEDGRGFEPEKPEYIPEAYGSGVVVDDKGLVLTNYHVVRDATKIYVRLPGDKAGYAAIHAADQRSDLAVLQLPKHLLPVKALKMGDGGKVRKGQFVLSLANPFASGFRDGSPSASWGILSNIRRRGPGNPREDERVKQLHQYGTLLQTDARLNLGCSGGALIDLKGELIGLTTALAAISGAETPGGFAVPMDAGMQRIIEKLKQGEEVEYGFLGVRFSSTRPARKGEGVPLETVLGGSPADKAGLRAGDYLHAINGVPVHDYDDLFLQIGTLLAGTTFRVEFSRHPGGERELSKPATLAKFYVPNNTFQATRKRRAVGGLRVDYTSVLVQRIANERLFGDRIPPGVVIREVERHSAADQAQLQQDKIITRVNDRPVSTPAEFYQVMENASGTVELTFYSPDGRLDKVRLEIK